MEGWAPPQVPTQDKGELDWPSLKPQSHTHTLARHHVPEIIQRFICGYFLVRTRSTRGTNLPVGGVTHVRDTSPAC